jgi:hypothetical protein
MNFCSWAFLFLVALWSLRKTSRLFHSHGQWTFSLTRQVYVRLGTGKMDQFRERTNCSEWGLVIYPSFPSFFPSCNL